MSSPSSVWDDFFDGSDYYTSPPFTEAMVADVERVLGYKLPVSYIRLLRVKNGGAPKLQCYPTAGTDWSDNHVRIMSLVGIGGRWGIDSAELGSRHLIREGGFPPEIGIIVGWTPTAGHDAIFLDYRDCGPNGEPRVTLVDAESGDTQVLAPTFEAFLRGLVDCRPYEEERERAMEEYRRRSRGS
jgi:SMI1-KNR4 cell-wall